jgi:hypothetical protein
MSSVSLYEHWTTPLEEELIIGEKLQSLELHVTNAHSVEFMKPEGIYQLLVEYRCFTNKHLYLFPHLQILSLIEVPNVTDLSSIKYVPYLHIDNCSGIKNFSCLGSQRSLTLKNCYFLVDRDLENYGSIHRLTILSWNRISCINNLHSNRFLAFENVSNLKEVSLGGNQYVKVEIKGCNSLKALNITGKVYFLSLSNCPIQLTPTNIRDHCKHYITK